MMDSMSTLANSGLGEGGEKDYGSEYEKKGGTPGGMDGDPSTWW